MRKETVEYIVAIYLFLSMLGIVYCMYNVKSLIGKEQKLKWNQLLVFIFFTPITLISLIVVGIYTIYCILDIPVIKDKK